MSQISHLRGIDPAMAPNLTQIVQSIIFTVVDVNLLMHGLTLPRLCSGYELQT